MQPLQAYSTFTHDTNDLHPRHAKLAQIAQDHRGVFVARLMPTIKVNQSLRERKMGSLLLETPARARTKRREKKFGAKYKSVHAHIFYILSKRFHLSCPGTKSSKLSCI